MRRNIVYWGPLGHSESDYLELLLSVCQSVAYMGKLYIQ